MSFFFPWACLLTYNYAKYYAFFFFPLIKMFVVLTRILRHHTKEERHVLMHLFRLMIIIFFPLGGLYLSECTGCLPLSFTNLDEFHLMPPKCKFLLTKISSDFILGAVALAHTARILKMTEANFQRGVEGQHPLDPNCKSRVIWKRLWKEVAPQIQILQNIPPFKETRYNWDELQLITWTGSSSGWISLIVYLAFNLAKK